MSEGSTVQSAKKENYKKHKYAKWKRENRHRYQDPKLWRPGQPLTEEDERMLREVRRRYHQLGYVPSKKEVVTSGQLKQRFRIWAHVLEAAGLPKYNDPEQIRIRQQKKEWERQMEELMR